MPSAKVTPAPRTVSRNHSELAKKSEEAARRGQLFDDGITVSVIARPLLLEDTVGLTREQLENYTCIDIHRGTQGITVHDNEHHARLFNLDHCFNATSEGWDEELFTDVGTSVVGCTLQGYRSCMFTFGESDSGKSFVLFGDRSQKKVGLVERIVYNLFEEMNVMMRIHGERIDSAQKVFDTFHTYVSFCEVSNEQVRDLLSPVERVGLQINQKGDVEGLTKLAVETVEELLHLVDEGNRCRACKVGTSLNMPGSHTALRIEVERITLSMPPGSHIGHVEGAEVHIRPGVIQFFDLAGASAGNERDKSTLNSLNAVKQVVKFLRSREQGPNLPSSQEASGKIIRPNDKTFRRNIKRHPTSGFGMKLHDYEGHVIIRHVAPKGQGDLAGLKMGDEIVTVDGMPCFNGREVIGFIHGKNQVEFLLKRPEFPLISEATGQNHVFEKQIERSPDTFSFDIIFHDTKDGQVIIQDFTKSPGKAPNPAVKAGLQRGDRLLAVDGVAPASSKDLPALVAGKQKAVFKVSRPLNDEGSNGKSMYDNSIITRMMRLALGGNCVTTMLACVAPGRPNLQETLQTLRVAGQLMQAQNAPQAFVIKNHKYTTIFRKLLQDQLYRANIDVIDPDNIDVVQSVSMAQMAKVWSISTSEMIDGHLEKEWHAKLGFMRQMNRQRSNGFKQRGLISTTQYSRGNEHIGNPFLVHLHPDPQLTLSLLFPLLKGATTMGSIKNKQADLQLSGWEAMPEEVAIFQQSTSGVVTIRPGRGRQDKPMEILINGRRVVATQNKKLKSGDRIVIERRYFFVFLKSMVAAKRFDTSVCCPWEVVWQELLEVCGQKRSMRNKTQFKRTQTSRKMMEVRMMREIREADLQEEQYATNAQTGMTMQELAAIGAVDDEMDQYGHDYLTNPLYKHYNAPDRDMAAKKANSETIHQGGTAALSSPLESFSEIGFGVALYFMYLKYLSVMFLFMSALAIPIILVCYEGEQIQGFSDYELMHGRDAVNTMLGNFTIANIGHFDWVDDETRNQCGIELDARDPLCNEKEAFMLGFEVTMVTAANYVSFLDLLYSFAFLGFWILWGRQIRSLKLRLDKTNIKPSDFSVEVKGLPHNATKEEVRMHFSHIYDLGRAQSYHFRGYCFGLCCRRAQEGENADVDAMQSFLPVANNDLTKETDERNGIRAAKYVGGYIAEVVLVHPIGAHIRSLLKAEELLLSIFRMRATVKMHVTTGLELREKREIFVQNHPDPTWFQRRSINAIESQMRVRRKLVTNKKVSVAKLLKRVQKLKKVVARMDEQTAVVGAFVTFNHRESFLRCLADYGPSQNAIGHVFQPPPLRFRRPQDKHGAKLTVTKAPPPFGLLWENLEYTPTNRFMRKCFALLVVLFTLLISTSIILSLTDYSKSAVTDSLFCDTCLPMARFADNVTDFEKKETEYIVERNPDGAPEEACKDGYDFYRMDYVPFVPPLEPNATTPAPTTTGEFVPPEDPTCTDQGSFCSRDDACESANRDRCPATCQICTIGQTSSALFEATCDGSSEMCVKEFAGDKSDIGEEEMLEFGHQTCLMPLSVLAIEPNCPAEYDLYTDVRDCFCEHSMATIGTIDGLLEFGKVHGDICASFIADRTIQQVTMFGIAGTVAAINVMITFIAEWLANFEKHPNVGAQISAQITYTTLAMFINTAWISIFVNFDLKMWFYSEEGLAEMRAELANETSAEASIIPDFDAINRTGYDADVMEKFSSFFDDLYDSFMEGEYEEFNVKWYAVVGEQLYFTMALNGIIPPLCTVYFFAQNKLLSWFFAHANVMEFDVINAYKGDPLLLEQRYPFILNTMLVTMMYCGGLPLLLPIAGLSFYVLYWTDKFFLLRFYNKNKLEGLDEVLSNQASNWMPIAVLIHFCLSIGMYSNDMVSFDSRLMEHNVVNTDNETSWSDNIADDAVTLLFNNTEYTVGLQNMVNRSNTSLLFYSFMALFLFMTLGESLYKVFGYFLTRILGFGKLNMATEEASGIPPYTEAFKWVLPADEAWLRFKSLNSHHGEAGHGWYTNPIKDTRGMIYILGKRWQDNGKRANVLHLKHQNKSTWEVIRDDMTHTYDVSQNQRYQLALKKIRKELEHLADGDALRADALIGASNMSNRETGVFEKVIDEETEDESTRAAKKSKVHLRARQQEIREWYQTEMTYYEQRYNNKVTQFTPHYDNGAGLTASETQRQQERLGVLLKQRQRAEARVQKEFEMQMKLAKQAHHEFCSKVKRRLMTIMNVGGAFNEISGHTGIDKAEQYASKSDITMGDADSSEHDHCDPAEWKVEHDEDNHIYYLNTRTGETTWQIPHALEKIMDKSITAESKHPKGKQHSKVRPIEQHTLAVDGGVSSDISEDFDFKQNKTGVSVPLLSGATKT